MTVTSEINVACIFLILPVNVLQSYYNIFTSRSAEYIHLPLLSGCSFEITFPGRSRYRNFITLRGKTLYLSCAWSWAWITLTTCSNSKSCWSRYDENVEFRIVFNTQLRAYYCSKKFKLSEHAQLLFFYWTLIKKTKYPRWWNKR